MFVQSAEEGFGKDIRVNEAVHDAVDAMQFPDAMSGDTAQDHDAPATVLQFLFGVFGVVSFPWHPPAPLPAIGTKNVEFGLI